VKDGVASIKRDSPILACYDVLQPERRLEWHAMCSDEFAMSRTITILPSEERQLESTLREALEILQSNGVQVDSAVQHIHVRGWPAATILLQYLDDKSRALHILAKTGIAVEK